MTTPEVPRRTKGYFYADFAIRYQRCAASVTGLNRRPSSDLCDIYDCAHCGRTIFAGEAEIANLDCGDTPLCPRCWEKADRRSRRYTEFLQTLFKSIEPDPAPPQP